MEYNIIHNEERNRFEAMIDGLLCEVNYRKDSIGNLKIIHTGVPKILSGQGIAAALTEAALSYAAENSLKVCPSCPYTAAYIEKHPEYKDIVIDI